jgi:hypothetical protein
MAYHLIIRRSTSYLENNYREKKYCLILSEHFITFEILCPFAQPPEFSVVVQNNKYSSTFKDEYLLFRTSTNNLQALRTNQK